MAPSLQDLVNFLLNEIALCGDQGATLVDVLKAINTFYASVAQDAAQRVHTVDHRFQAKVWSWLTRNPEVSVGKNNKWNHLSLVEVEQLDLPAQVSQANGADGSEAALSGPQVRLFVSKERTWYAITGHEPDDTKVLPMEFVLLSIIASHKSEGIPQTELPRLSGQDKRSIPKRTDSLHKKGYIEKRPVQVKSARTSLCTLRRFLQPDQKPEALTQAERVIDFEAFVTKLFEILKEFRIIARNDLKRLLGYEDIWRSRILSRALRKFERIGLLKRVRAESQYEKLHPCVMLLRDPTPRDLELFVEYEQDIGGQYGADDRAELDEDIDLGATGKPAPSDTVPGAVDLQKEVIEDAGRIIPSWTPDRILYNQIFDTVNSAGTAGITNLNIHRTLFGSFFRRPLESALYRLVDCWQLSQPPHLRHLAIVRDTAMDRTVVHYIHYSARNFKTLVEAGEASWEAVEYTARKTTANHMHIPPANIILQLDQYGFPQHGLPRRLFRNGSATLLECIAVCKPMDYLRSRSDFVAVRLENGQYVARSGHQKLPFGAWQQMVNQRPLGRPKGSVGRATTVKGKESLQLTPDREEIVTEEPLTVPAHARRIMAKQARLRGLSKKEKYEALGMDESWTEYNALLMERPTPGVYVTPIGRRRPVGKARGRPRQSRIAIFKSPKLASLPWFEKEQTDSEVDEAEETIMEPRQRVSETPVHVSTALQPKDQHPQLALEIPASPRRAKRARTVLDDADAETISPRPKRGRPRKHPHLDNAQDVTDTPISVDAAPETRPETRRDVVDRAATEAQAKGAAVHTLEVDKSLETPSKRRRLESTEHLQNKNLPQPAASADNIATVDTVLKTEPDGPGRPVPATPRIHIERGGSINILRRKIVMEILEKAGGVYPSGVLLWYPFTTAWLKTNRKEKPDLRTVKSTVMHLVDAGRLRQLTFSGRDPRGVMVTKTLLTTAEISPNDPLVREMQNKALSADRYTKLSPHVEVDPTLSKVGGRGLGQSPRQQKSLLPVEPGATVNLQRKPAFAVLEEKRRERKIQRQLLRNLEAEIEALDESRPGPGVKRLMRIQRPSAQDPSALAHTSISRPQPEPARGRKRGPYKRRQPVDRRPVKMLSTLRPFVMLMRPGQTFHPSTGTFGTAVGAAAARTRKLVPKPGERRVSIDELAQLAHQPSEAVAADLLHERFMSTADEILKWELEHQDLLSENLAGLPYINQAVQGPFADRPIKGDIRFDKDAPRKALPPESRPVTTRSAIARRRPQPEAPPTDRRLSKLSAAAENALQPAAKRQVSRRQRAIQPVSEDLARKLMLAVVAVRVLAGGTEGKLVDWNLVTACFPDRDPKFIEPRARLTLSKNRLQVAKMQRDFQERFLEAYANGQVPRIDYENLESYDWATIIEWADGELDAPIFERLPDLPATRQQFDSIFELREEHGTAADELQHSHLVSVVRKRSLLAHVPFAVPASDDLRPAGPRKEELARLEIAKTWVRANIIAPEESYRPADAKLALSRFGEPLIDSAVQSLLTERVIGMSNKGRINPGRMYDITDHFLQTLSRKRDIDSIQLQRAAHFKTTILDPALESNGVFDVKYNAEDGDILALINLAASGRVDLRPRDPPRDKFGLTDGGYQTRQMDKLRLRFAVEVRPLAAYVYGNPVHNDTAPLPPLPSPPPSEDNTLPPRIPVWLDIHGAFVPRLWDKLVAAVLGCIALRPQIDAARIASMIKPTMGAWETLLLLQWLADVGVVCAKGSGEQAGWVVKEWWWMVL